MEMVYRVDEIADAAKTLWQGVDGATVLAFEGKMGAGKTTFIQAICRHLGVSGPLSSPTFSIINEYSSPSGSVYHIDLYRCRNEEEVVRAGVEDCLYSGNICFVEWPSVAEGIFPPDTITIAINEVDINTRKIIVNRKLYGQTIH